MVQSLAQPVATNVFETQLRRNDARRYVLKLSAIKSMNRRVRGGRCWREG